MTFDIARLARRGGPFVNALLAGLVGAVVAHLINAPMPWLIGAMAGTAAFSLTGRKVAVYQPLRMGMVAVLGVLLGSSFTPEFYQGLVDNLIILVLLLIYTLLATGFVFTMLTKTTKVDRVTAFFSAVPGGVNEMTIMGAERGGHEASLAVHHSLRLILVIFNGVDGLCHRLRLLPDAAGFHRRQTGLPRRLRVDPRAGDRRRGARQGPEAPRHLRARADDHQCHRARRGLHRREARWR